MVHDEKGDEKGKQKKYIVSVQYENTQLLCDKYDFFILITAHEIGN